MPQYAPGGTKKVLEGPRRSQKAPEPREHTSILPFQFNVFEWAVYGVIFQPYFTMLFFSRILRGFFDNAVFHFFRLRHTF